MTRKQLTATVYENTGFRCRKITLVSTWDMFELSEMVVVDVEGWDDV